MNRCISASFSTARCACMLSALVALAPLPAAAEAQFFPTAQPAVRTFPAKALRATMEVKATPDILIDGKPARLSPGARIYDANRMLVLSASLTGQKLLVNFVREPQGLVHEVWILSEAEARLPQALATPHPYSQ